MTESPPTAAPTSSTGDAYARIFDYGEDGYYTAHIVELPGCIAEGETLQAAAANIDRALADMIGNMRREGVRVPDAYGVGDVYAGVRVQLTPSVHSAAAKRAAAEGVTLTQVIARAIAAYVAEPVAETRRLAVSEDATPYEDSPE